jgi:hypothetical protein
MDVSKFLIKNNKGEPSVTLTAFIIGFLVVNAKLLASGLTIHGIVLSVFTGMDYSVSIGALGAVYVLRRNGVEAKKIEKDKEL